jgi:hypothetical protein
MESDKARRRHFAIGIPVIVLSACAGLASLADFTSLGDFGRVLRVSTSAASFLAGVLASLQTFFDFGSAASGYTLAKQRLFTLNRRVDHLAFHKTDDEMQAAIREFDDSLDKAMTDAPKAPLKTIENARRLVSGFDSSTAASFPPPLKPR